MSLTDGDDWYYGNAPDIDKIPEEVKKDVLKATVRQLECPNCGDTMFYRIVAGHNSVDSCNNCNEEFKVVG